MQTRITHETKRNDATRVQHYFSTHNNTSSVFIQQFVSEQGSYGRACADSESDHAKVRITTALLQTQCVTESTDTGGESMLLKLLG
jgi:hypothetical protein